MKSIPATFMTVTIRHDGSYINEEAIEMDASAIGLILNLTGFVDVSIDHQAQPDGSFVSTYTGRPKPSA